MIYLSCCLSYPFIAVLSFRCHDQGNIQKSLLGLEFQRLSPWPYAGEHGIRQTGDRHGAGVVTKSLHPYPQVGGREPTGSRIDFF